MINKLVKKVFGTRNQRLLNAYRKEVLKVNALEESYRALSDAELGAKTSEFRQRLQSGTSLEQLLSEAFATVREASRRILNMRHFDVQLMGGMALHYGKVAEMRTGEGKTLMATLALYLNALPAKGVHLVTANDYLAKRDAEWMRPLYEFLGLSVGINLPGMDQASKKLAYGADITYGTNNEFGFDYLRDNMVFNLEQKVQRALNFAVVDEVDSILIDEARTPLIISGQVEESSEMYARVNQLIPQLKLQKVEEDPKNDRVLTSEERGDYTIDEKSRQAHLTEEGHQHVEELFVRAGLLPAGSSLYDPANISLMHYLLASLRAHSLFHKDVDYIVKNGQIIIVDEHTGRLMEGRRWSDGLHQAIEAKEGVSIQLENQTLATITFQNYFRLYEKLGGMTGTADTEAFELQKIYGLEVVVIPTNQPMVRQDHSDCIYLTAKDKYQAIIKDIEACRAKNQPVLVGTASIESSELLSKLLQQAKIPHQVLNAKQHEREANIIAEAGRPGSVTIATNMAGRGTDIVLGGNLKVELAELKDPSDEQIADLQQEWQQRHEQVITAGGLHVIGTERHESRRIDNQLRGRSGRQGDPGSTQFYLSLEDNLLRIFAGERMAMMMRRLGVNENDVIQHPWITRAIENAQRRVEGHNFDIRKQLLEFDDVANDQRKVIYAQRYELLQAEHIAETIDAMRVEVIEELVHEFLPPGSFSEQWDLVGLEQKLANEFALHLPLQEWVEKENDLDEESIAERITLALQKAYAEKEALTTPEAMRSLEKNIMLQVMDNHWREHLAAMDYLRQGIHLRGYAQKNPAQEFKRESFNLFTSMLDGLKHEVIATLSRIQITNREPDSIPENPPQFSMNYNHADFNAMTEGVAEDKDSSSVRHSGPKLGRNDPCHCGSGKKYKQCHGKI
ncbi:MAG TPA: preprotein translocase subunit SecA [Coxiellaceae bacterium]|nr:preprotein translocase subunit SecA [Coxiellaceae bacterium]